jgi:hypothetical protein
MIRLHTNGQNSGGEPTPEQLETKLRGMILKAKDAVVSRLRTALGDHFDDAASSPATTLRLTENPDPKIRGAAFGLLCEYWPPNPELEGLYRRTIMSDPDLHVRCGAMFCFIHLHKGTINQEVAQFLARIAKNESEPAELQSIAYKGVMRIMDLPIPLAIMRELRRCRDHLPEGLDWGVVDSLLSGSKHGL